MPRKTRAAAKAEEAVMADASADVDAPQFPTPKREREPLRSITPNSVDSLDNERPMAEKDMSKAKAKGNKGKKGPAKKKGRKAKAEKADEHPQVIEETAEDVIAQAAEAIEEETVVAASSQSRPTSSVEKSTRKTRRQLAMEEAEAQADPELERYEARSLEVVPPEPKAISGELILSPPLPEPELEIPTLEPFPLVQAPSIIEESAMGHAADLLSVTEEINERAKPEPLSLVASNETSRRSSQVKDPIEAIDALEDEIDEVAKIIPNLDSPTSPVKPMNTTIHSSTKPSVNHTSSVRAGLSKHLTTTQPSATARIHALAEPRKPANGLSRSTSTKARPVSGIEPKPGVVEKLTSNGTTKRRPISIHFPAPPQPPKSKKPPTTVSTFSLPGDAVAAKLKAARIERQKRQEEEAAAAAAAAAVHKREFKARPAPTIRLRPVEVKQTATSRARQSVIDSHDKGGSHTEGLKRSSTVTGATTTAASKRNSVIIANRSSVVGAPRASISVATTNMPQKRGSIILSKPASGVNIPKPRAAPSTTALKDQAPSSTSTSAVRNVSASDAAAQRQKGKEVYNRDKVEQEAREKAQKEKDDAIKRARAEAAERGRQASREWAEKQKKLASERKTKSTPVETEITAHAA